MEINELTKTIEYKEIVKFLKKENLYGQFINFRYKKNYVADLIKSYVSDEREYCDFGLRISKELNNPNYLVIAQLWRFFLIEELKDNEPQFLNCETLVYLLEKSIRANGSRGSKRLRELFFKYNY